MKIIGLKITGLRKISALEMVIKKTGLIPIKGKNRQGKTTILDALEILFRGNKLLEQDMIQHGAEKAEIEGTVENSESKYIIKRVITPNSNRLEIKNAEGLVMNKKPQEWLDGLVNDLTFNPRPFLEQDSDKKLKFMMGLMKIDFTAIDKQIVQKEQDRLVVGRQVKDYGEAPLPQKVSKVDVTDILDRKQRLIQANAEAKKNYEDLCQLEINRNIAYNEKQGEAANKIIAAEGFVRSYEKEASDIASEIEELKNKLLDLENALVKCNATIKQEREKVAALPKPEETVNVYTFNKPVEPEYADLSALDQELAAVSQTNVAAAQYEEAVTKFKQKADKQAEYGELSRKIEELRRSKQTILAETKMPVPGLEIKEIPGEEGKLGLFYNDIFSENWSEAEGLKIASKLCVAMKPKLSAVFLDKAESMDSEALKDYEKWAEENDIQAIVTIVSDIPEKLEDNTYYIEDGHFVVAADDGAEGQPKLELE